VPSAPPLAGGGLPTDGLKIHAPKLDEPRVPKPVEVRLILDWLKKECPWVYRFCVTLICTGARTGEVVSLTWDRVGFARTEKDDTLTLVRRKVGDKLTVPMAETLQRELFAMWMEKGQPLEGLVFHVKHCIYRKLIGLYVHRIIPRIRGPKGGQSRLTDRLTAGTSEAPLKALTGCHL
jgi:integrase